MTTYADQSIGSVAVYDHTLFETWRARAVVRFGHLSPSIHVAERPEQLVNALHRAYDAIDGEDGHTTKVSIAQMYTNIRKAFNLPIDK
jgi:hypothetical protein